MTKTKKFFLLIAILLLGFIVFFSMVMHQSATSLLPFNFIKPRHYPIIGDYLNQFLFWASLTLLAIALIAFFVVLFWPTNRKTQIMAKSDGELSINDQAINNIVHQITKNKSWLTDTKIKSQLKKNRININIKGTLLPVQNAKEHTRLMIDQIKRELSELLGIKDDKQINISLQNFRPKNKGSQTRVI